MLWWLLAVGLIVLGVVGTVVPMLPGAGLIWLGILLAAWIDDFTVIGSTTLVVTGLLAVLSWLTDYVSGVIGAKRVNATREAVIGAAIGTVLGVFSGLWGLLFMPLLGAAIGEYIALRDTLQAGRVGVATWIGVLLGAVAQVALAFLMIGVFVVALLVD